MSSSHSDSDSDSESSKEEFSDGKSDCDDEQPLEPKARTADQLETRELLCKAVLQLQSVISSLTERIKTIDGDTEAEQEQRFKRYLDAARENYLNEGVLWKQQPKAKRERAVMWLRELYPDKPWYHLANQLEFHSNRVIFSASESSPKRTAKRKR